MKARIVLFLRRQRNAWLDLFSRRKHFDTITLCPPPDPSHPSALCRCFDGVTFNQTQAAHADHKLDCPWLAAMCYECLGTGCCERCGGDGCDPDRSKP